MSNLFDLEMYTSFNQVLLFSVCASSLWLGSSILLSNPRQKLNKLFFLISIFISLWIFFGYFAYFSTTQFYAIYFTKLAYLSVSFFVALFYYFFISILKEEDKYRKLNIVVFLVSLFFALISLFSNLIIENVLILNVGINPIFSIGAYLFYLYVFFVFSFVLYRLDMSYYRMSGKDKNKINYFFVGTAIFLILNIIFNIILPIWQNSFKYYQYGNYSSIIFLIFTAYAITKQELMGIKVLIAQMLIAIMSIILLVDIIVLSTDSFMRIMKIGVLITFLYFGKSLIEGVKKEKKIATKLENANEKIKHYVDKLEDNNKILEEGNQNMKALIDVGNIAIDANDSKKIAQGIVDIIPKSLKHLGIIGGVFLTYDRNKQTINPYAITEILASRKAMKYLIKPFNKYKVLIAENDTLVAQTIKKKRIFIGQKLDDFISPPVNTNICKMIQKVTRAKSFLSLPLYSNGVVIGSLLFFGLKKEKEITEKDINILEIFSSHIGNAIENARLYEQTILQIAELAKLNKNLGLKNVQLKELLEIKNEFLHITSHQLRTPLTVIRGMISMWVNGDFDHLSKMEKKKMIKRILVSTERLNNITNDMLDALELEGGFLKFQFQKSSIIDIVKETISTLKPNFDKKKLYIKIIIEKNIPDVDVEPNYIRQVFMNTIDNACKYTRKGGITISLKKKGKKYVEVKIKDTGVGIKKDEIGKIFEKFSRGKNAIVENASGSGLGLFIARKILMSHSGKINFKSDGLGKGTTISILLKINQE